MTITRLSLDGYGARRQGSFAGRTETVVVIMVVGMSFTPSDAVDAAAFSISEITGNLYTAVDGIDGMPT